MAREVARVEKTDEETGVDLSSIDDIWLPLAVLDEVGTVRGSTRFQKLVFLAQVEALGELFSFRKCNFGPFSSDLSRTVSVLKFADFVDERITHLNEPYYFRRDYQLTKKGVLTLRKLEKEKSLDHKRLLLSAVLKRYADMTLEHLLSQVYERYLPNEGDFATKLAQFRKELEFYEGDWNERREKHYPVSLRILCAFERIERVMEQIDTIADRLERTVILNSASDILCASKDLFQSLERYSAGLAPGIAVEIDSDDDKLDIARLVPAHIMDVGFEDENYVLSDPAVDATYAQFVRAYSFFEEYCSSRNILIPLSKLTVDGITTDEERDRIKRALDKLL